MPYPDDLLYPSPDVYPGIEENDMTNEPVPPILIHDANQGQ